MKRGIKAATLLFLLFFNGLYISSFGQVPCLDIQINNLTCEIDTTPDNPFDNSYTFDLTITGGSTGWKARIANDTLNGAYGISTNVGSFYITSGPLFLIVYDSINQICGNYQTIIPPNCSVCESATINTCANEQVELRATTRNLWGYENYTAFQWYKDDVLITGATDSIYIATSSGVYSCLLYTSPSPRDS